MGTDEFNAMSNPAMNEHPIQRGIEIFLIILCYINGNTSGLMGHWARVCRLNFPLPILLEDDFLTLEALIS